MTKVYPNAAATAAAAAAAATPTPATERLKSIDESSMVLTVWKKSLLFNCDGFTVFDAHGNLVFRVDNYYAASKAEISLMDASGKSLLTFRRKRLGLADNWMVFEGESAVNPLFSVRKNLNRLRTNLLARVMSGCSGSGSSSPPSSPGNKKSVYEIEGSYSQRCCAVYDSERRRVAEIKRKEAVGGVAFGVDVFRLIVEPEIDSAVAMALVILLDRMFGSSRRFSALN
ncbi:protein LURP-one-related 8 [Cornus florida]|uniref:protein LURP-one-related 8 n=1 Tax=Cornus florida TaxID=4283 RepID=UPI00289A6C42|nr:protein LURP-one-related 8 [Cornus florida]